MMTIERLLILTIREGRWMHRNRHLEIVKRLVIARNLVNEDPFSARKRIEWNRALEEFRNSPEHPDYEPKGDNDANS